MRRPRGTTTRRASASSSRWRWTRRAPCSARSRGSTCARDVVSASLNERNYHVFYQLVSGHPQAGGAALGLGEGAAAFQYLSRTKVVAIAAVDDASDYVGLRDAMDAIGLSRDDAEATLEAVAALLHLGNVTYEGKGNEPAKLSAGGVAAAERACRLLGTPSLPKCLVQRTMTTRGETTDVALSVDQAALGRDALAKAVYSALFDMCVRRVNTSMAGSGTEASPFIGLLDVFGFESFEVNRFEQLCINLANEKLQSLFLQSVFKAEEGIYKAEEIEWTLEYAENEGCILLVEQPKKGIMPLLDEACKRPGGPDDKAFSDSVHKQHRADVFYLTPVAMGFKRLRPDEGFGVRHFAGDVLYTASGFCEKNNDTLHSDFAQMLSRASNPAVRAVFAPAEGKAAEGEEASGGRARKAFNSVSRKFIGDVNGLMESLASTKAHFVRCIKPNTALQPALFTPSLVLAQLRSSGTVNAVELLASAMPTRIPYSTIYGRYAEHCGELIERIKPPPTLFCEALVLAMDIPADDFKLGRRKMFFKAGAGAVLESLQGQDMKEVIPQLMAKSEKIQQWARSVEIQLRMQATCRAFLEARRFKRKVAAASALQHAVRSQAIRVHAYQSHLKFLARREHALAEQVTSP